MTAKPTRPGPTRRHWEEIAVCVCLGIALALCITACASAPQASPDDVLGETHTNAEGGFSFRTIPDYTIENIGGVSNLLAPGADPDYGPVATLIGYVSPISMTTGELYAQIVRDTLVNIDEATSINVQGIPGLAANFSRDLGDPPVRGRLAMVMVTPTQQFILMFGAPETEWDNVSFYFDALLKSLEFFEPADPAL